MYIVRVSLSVTCDMGYYFDHGSWKCRICPYSAYCDNNLKYNCPDKMVTEEMGSLWEGDCKNGKMCALYIKS